ncbi:MAG: hypothetical protein IT291_06550 [Deltaproteobacteria bacterium]|nr:hypothetical protein [Deltaproteobacteria bacterium]
MFALRRNMHCGRVFFRQIFVFCFTAMLLGGCVVLEKLPSRQSKEEKQVEVLTSGDIIHRVTYQGENVGTIARWYTGDISNTGRIARINDLNEHNALPLGSRVRIPRYLLTTNLPLPYAQVGPQAESGATTSSPK